jgi:hypothetical protein
MMDLAQIAEASSKLATMLESVLQYVDDVLSGKTPPDNQVFITIFIIIVLINKSMENKEYILYSF